MLGAILRQFIQFYLRTRPPECNGLELLRDLNEIMLGGSSQFVCDQIEGVDGEQSEPSKNHHTRNTGGVAGDCAAAADAQSLPLCRQASSHHWKPGDKLRSRR